MQKVKKAIIAVAGSGTRLLPATKSMPKEMLPIVDKPIIQLIAEELVDAGVQPKANVYDSEATLSIDSQEVTLAENNYNLALLTLSQLLQVPYEGFNVEIVDVDLPSVALLYKDVKPVLNYAMENRSEIKVAEKTIESAKLGSEISKSGFYPRGR